MRWQYHYGSTLPFVSGQRIVKSIDIYFMFAHYRESYMSVVPAVMVSVVVIQIIYVTMWNIILSLSSTLDFVVAGVERKAGEKGAI